MVNKFNRRHPFFPHYPDDSDYNTNAPGYSEDLARKTKLIKLLAKRIWEYENTLNETLEQIEKRLTDYILENDSLMNERLENWDKRIEEMPEEMRSLFVEWLNDGTLEQIINHDVLGNKADQSELDKTNEQLEHISITPEQFGAVGDGLNDDTQAVQNAIDYSIDKKIGAVLFRNDYLISETLNIPTYDRQLHLKGNGKLFFDTPNLLSFNQNSVIIEGLEFNSLINGNAYAITGNLIQSKIKNCSFNDCGIYLTGRNRDIEVIGNRVEYVTNSVSYGIFIANVVNYIVSDNIVIKGYDAIKISNADEVESEELNYSASGIISNNICKESIQDGIDLYTGGFITSVTNNIIEDTEKMGIVVKDRGTATNLDGRIEQISISGNIIKKSGAGIQISANNIVCSSNSIYESSGTGIALGVFDSTISDIETYTGIHVNNNYINNAVTGIYGGRVYDVISLSGNTIINCSEVGIDLLNGVATITGGLIENCDECGIRFYPDGTVREGNIFTVTGTLLKNSNEINEAIGIRMFFLNEAYITSTVSIGYSEAIRGGSEGANVVNCNFV